MKIRKSAMVLAATLLTVTGGSGAWALGETAVAEIKDAKGQVLGTATMTEMMAGVLVNVKLKGLTPGLHGFHIHAIGKCEGDFTGAGEIYNPFGAQHGFLNEEGPMPGDLPNLIADANGNVEVELIGPSVTLSNAVEDSLLDTDGAAFVIFEKGGDHISPPEGSAGGRIACGVIEQKAP